MPYRIKKSDADMAAAMRRIADEQIARALEESEDTRLDLSERVHQVRKRCKKLRGLVRLVRPAFDAYADENAAFRDAARLLSGVRDADTLIDTYDAVAERFEDQIDRRAFAPIRARLTREANVAREDPETAARMERVRADLEAARVRAAGWTLGAAGFDAVAGGLRKTYGRARKRMQAAWIEPTDTAMHEWRKRVKYHWYHARLLERTLPAMMEAHAAAAHDLSDLLGDHHDLAVLDARLAATPEIFGTATDVAAFRALVARHKQDLARDAFGLGRIVLAERSKALAKRWGGYWKASKKDDADAKRLLVKA
jgi:CHAD domain-containing protein